jgi:hypothetical protein
VTPLEQIEEHKRRVEMMGEEETIALNGNATSLDFMKAVYLNEGLPLGTRMRAATAALPFEHPKLSVTAVVDDESFASALERAVRRSDKARTKIIEAAPMKVIEPPKPKFQTDCRLPPMNHDKRLRRL